jgi:hypothetical protein
VTRLVIGAAAVSALGAGLNVEGAAGPHLVGVVVVGEDAAIEADVVGLALAQDLLGRVGVETGYRHHRDTHHLLDARRQGDVAQCPFVTPVHLLGKLVEREMRLGIEQDIGEVRALVHARPVIAHVQRVDPVGFVDAGDLLAFLDCEPLVACTDLEGIHQELDREILSAALLDLLDDLHDEPAAVLHALRAVYVIPLVPEARQEAVEEVVGGRIDLDAVPAGLP